MTLMRLPTFATAAGAADAIKPPWSATAAACLARIRWAARSPPAASLAVTELGSVSSFRAATAALSAALAGWLPELTGAALGGALAAGGLADDCGAAAVAGLGVVGFVGRNLGAIEDIEEMDIMWPIFLAMRRGRACAR